MTKRELSRLKKKWVDRLGLQFWDITLEYPEMPDHWGLCTYDAASKIATINIHRLASRRWKNSKRDPEEVLIHELQHLVIVQFRIFEKNPNEEVEEEIVEYYTKLLVRMERNR